jgi:DNA-binding transcriptional MocR family regulator
MEEGHFAAHIRRMRLQYRDKRDELVAAIKSRLGAYLTVNAPDQGMHLVAFARRGLSDVAIERAGRQNGVVVRAAACYALTGNIDRSKHHAAEVLRLMPEFSISRYVPGAVQAFKRPQTSDRRASQGLAAGMTVASSAFIPLGWSALAPLRHGDRP